MSNTDHLKLDLDECYLSMRGMIFVHAGKNQRAAELAVYGDGVVLHGAAGFRAGRELPSGTITLIDREQYLDDRASQGTIEMFPETAGEAVEQQLRMGAACLLAPSRFPADRTDRSIRAELAAGQEFVEVSRALAPDKPVFVPVVVRFDELADRRWIQPVLDSRIPIATIFAGHNDPLASAEQLRGAVDLVQAAEAALVLRCDLSAAGLMAHGAGSGAIGASSSVRHLWLPSRSSNKSSNKGPRRSMFVPSLANWMKSQFIRQAQADPDLDDVFHCDCAVCGPDGDVRRLSNADTDLQDRHRPRRASARHGPPARMTGVAHDDPFEVAARA
jgi:hypothetical protein